MTIEKPLTCEDCLAYLLFPDEEFVIDKSDIGILNSINNQLRKKIALTDRQYELVKTKLLQYIDQFEKRDVDVAYAATQLKHELREIDRSHWLKILDYKDEAVLGIRFPFSKKIISRIEELRGIDHLNINEHSYKDNTHCFPFTPSNVFKLVEIANRFETKFVIHDDIIEIYNQLLIYEDNKADYIPGVYGYDIKNIPQDAVNTLTETLGECTKDTLALYYERRYLYGLHYFDMNNVEPSVQRYSTLSQQIINRDHAVFLIDKKQTTLDTVASALLEINRFPILVVLTPNKASDQLLAMHSALKYILPSEQMTVWFRKDGADPFNEYIKKENLNNPLDKNTKVVYISNNKLPKPILKSQWVPNCTVSFETMQLTFNNVSQYAEHTDLRIVYDDIAVGGLWDRNERKYIRAFV
jgi:hypothetical protein|tara:strand:+ start:137 stop:1372 length:1236 start_codon:yes stop_codon:yes gene_type:complete